MANIAANIPPLRKFAIIPTGGEAPFHCEVYFVNKTETQGRPTTEPVSGGVDTFLLTINTIMLFVFFLLEKNIVGGYYIIVDK